MDDNRARALLREERQRVERLIAQTRDDAVSDRAEADSETGDIADPAERQTAQEVDDALVEGLESRLQAISRAEQRLDAGTYGQSVRSGQPIPDARLEADPAAELTVEEAALER
jgi:DnaK suppressor protein